MTEERYLLEIDSSQRDTVKYPNPNDYIVTVNRPMYNINQNQTYISKNTPPAVDNR